MATTWAKASTVILAVLLFFGILTVWLPPRWPVGVLHAGIFALALGWVAPLFWRADRPQFSFPLIPLAGAVLWGLLQLLAGWTVYRFETHRAVLDWAAALAVFWLALELLARRELRHGFRKALLYFGFVLSVLSVVQYFGAPGKIFGVFPVEYRNVGPFLNREHYSSFVELILPLALWKAIRDSRRTLSHALIAGVLFASVIAGASRAGSILVTLEILVVLFIGLSPRLVVAGTMRRALAWSAFFAVVFAAVVGWEVLWRRFQDPDPYRGRREMLQSSLAMIRDRPWTGFGLGTWSTAYPAYALVDWGLFANHAHNDWAEWIAEGGLPFAALLLSVAVWSVRQATRHPWGLGVPSVFLHCLVGFPMQRVAVAALTFTLLGALAAASSEAVPRRS